MRKKAFLIHLDTCIADQKQKKKNIEIKKIAREKKKKKPEEDKKGGSV